MLAGGAAPAAADDRAMCFTGTFSGSVKDDNVAACTRLIAAKKDLLSAYIQRGRFYTRRGDNWDQAIADFGEALRLDPRNVDALALHGVLTINRGDAARAQAEMNEAIRLDPKSAIAHNSIGFFHNTKGDYDRALAEINEAIRLEPKFGYAYKNRGLIYENKGTFDKALADFRTALNLDPGKQERLGRHAALGDRARSTEARHARRWKQACAHRVNRRSGDMLQGSRRRRKRRGLHALDRIGRIKRQRTRPYLSPARQRLDPQRQFRCSHGRFERVAAARAE
ncbi:MAG: hypothetical protein QOJ58_1887 [Alphaproteobacteria bacterium]|nr:hypothetical protein [Alphaproteobacteria bacterium]